MIKNPINKEYNTPVEIADGIFWVGYFDEEDGLHCNPYLIIEGDEAVLIDGGSRNDFSSVMIKILQTGLNPYNISRLILQHYDPDLCSSIPHFEKIIDNKNLKLISQKENNVFIKYYATNSPRGCIDEMGGTHTFKSGRTLKFFKTPYCHSAGSFMTFDEQTGTLFSSDLFGCYGQDWDLFIELEEECHHCNDYRKCKFDRAECHVEKMINFHERIMTSVKALNYAMNQVEKINNVKIIAPQHGSIIVKKKDIQFTVNKLKSLKNVGIDKFNGDNNE